MSPFYRRGNRCGEILSCPVTPSCSVAESCLPPALLLQTRPRALGPCCLGGCPAPQEAGWKPRFHIPGPLALYPGSLPCPDSHPWTWHHHVRLLPAHPCAGPRGPPAAPEAFGEEWLQPPGGSRAWHPEFLLHSRCALPPRAAHSCWRDPLPARAPGPSPCPAVRLKAICSFCPAGRPTILERDGKCSACWLSPVASATSCPGRLSFLSLCPGQEWTSSLPPCRPSTCFASTG